MRWKDFVYSQVVDYCDKNGSRTFALSSFTEDTLDTFKSYRPENKHLEAKIRQQLQFLRDDNKITFLDNSGHYTLRGIELLTAEKIETININFQNELPEKKEYLVETYVRNVAWAKLAVKQFGDRCLYPRCENSFFREDGSRYIEVHHIIPLCKGGEDGLWNLSVLCAHHHKMAHFGDIKTRSILEKQLLNEVKFRL